ncbi:MAG: hypothetical protein KA314_04720 [Chloroflexi bacterium]|nr:hypothetical protein [Chloroflexota bacterium]
MEDKPSDKELTRQIYELLEMRHPVNGMGEWATFRELNIGTGSFGGRFIDFFAMNLWPSKNYLKVAYEVKVSRADFTKELKYPQKREGAERVANECYFVVPSGLLQFDEIPQGWGLLVMQKDGLKCAKKAMQRKVEQLPEAFVMSLARRGTDKPAPIAPVVEDDLTRQWAESQQKKQEEIYRIVRDEMGWSILNSPKALREYLRLGKKVRQARHKIADLLRDVKEVEELLTRPEPVQG